MSSLNLPILSLKERGEVIDEELTRAFARVKHKFHDYSMLREAFYKVRDKIFKTVKTCSDNVRVCYIHRLCSWQTDNFPHWSRRKPSQDFYQDRRESFIQLDKGNLEQSLSWWLERSKNAHYENPRVFCFKSNICSSDERSPSINFSLINVQWNISWCIE